MKQKQQVLDHLKNHGSLTTLIACEQLRCFRLSERIRELERDGHLINRCRVQKGNRNYTAYSLVA
jgi:hypothetical protein